MHRVTRVLDDLLKDVVQRRMSHVDLRRPGARSVAAGASGAHKMRLLDDLLKDGLLMNVPRLCRMLAGRARPSAQGPVL